MGSRKLDTYAATLIATVLVFLFVARCHPPLAVSVIEKLIHVSTQVGARVSVTTSASFGTDHGTTGDLLQLYDLHDHHLPSRSLPYLQPLVQCHRDSNPKTAHIRLPVQLLNITLKPLATRDEETESAHFNPTIIPLPSHAASFTPARYLLVTRLVTPGLHQESLACLATFCLPHTNETATHLPPDTVPCSSADEAALGPTGGMRCITKPRRLNIPPTPAKQCTGEWASFPDIPGFHDPRIMWSGTGEPLIVVNSASTYGCIGLWIMDLRALLPELRAVMERKAPALSVEEEDKNMLKRADSGDERQRAHGEYSQPVLRYDTLTELTRWEGRSEVEKNWILWFPGQEGETWVSYDSFGHWKPEGGHAQDDQAHAEEATQKNESQGDQEVRFEQQRLLPPIPPWPALNISNATRNITSGSMASISGHWDISLGVPAPNTTSSANEATQRNRTRPPAQQNTTAINHQPIKRTNQPKPRTVRNPSSAPYSWTFHGGRSIAKLTGHGHTTPNLTSPNEPPCLAPSSFTDTLNQTGHFHQSTPALTLILCERYTLSPSSGNTNTLHNQTNTSPSCATFGSTLSSWTSAGLAVHFSIMHRKFSHPTLGMPLRYKRYAVVWEGAYPFHILGVSRHPLAFAREVVRPWSRGENGFSDDDSDTEEDGNVLSKVGFTYTTSVAWAWRPQSAVMFGAGEEEEDDDAEQLARLGVGFLGDEVIVGVGLDDVAQAVVRVKVDELLGCLKLCPGVGGEADD